MNNITNTIVPLIFLGAIGTTGSYTEGSLPMHIIDLNCTGSELSVLDCPHNGLTGIHTCDHRQDASVRCQGIVNFYTFVHLEPLYFYYGYCWDHIK